MIFSPYLKGTTDNLNLETSTIKEGHQKESETKQLKSIISILNYPRKLRTFQLYYNYHRLTHNTFLKSC